MTPTDRPEFLFVGSREVREIPKGWQHPKDASGKYIPLLAYGSDDESASPETTMPPTPWRGETEIAAYEATTEGTPISPAFPNTDDGRLALINYCARALLHLRPQQGRCRGVGGDPLRWRGGRGGRPGDVQ